MKKGRAALNYLLCSYANGSSRLVRGSIESQAGRARNRECVSDPSARRHVHDVATHCAVREIITSSDGGPSTTPNQHMLITADTRFGQITNASVEREHDQNRGQASLASARRLRGEDHANDSHASGARRGSSALRLPGTRGRGTGRPGRGRHRSHALGEARVRGAYAGDPEFEPASRANGLKRCSRGRNSRLTRSKAALSAREISVAPEFTRDRAGVLE